MDVDVARRVARLAVIIDNESDAHRMVDAKRSRIVPLPHYSTNDDDAYLLINMLQGHGFACRISSNSDSGDIVWGAEFIKSDKSWKAQSCESLAHATCLAALKLAGD